MADNELTFPPSAVSSMDTTVAVLSSWKDIAKFLGKGVRTAQRWEKDLGLPVRRPKQAGKSTVLAIPLEINDWVCLQGYASDHRKDSVREREDILRQVEELKAENAELRRQVQVLCAKSA